MITDLPEHDKSLNQPSRRRELHATRAPEKVTGLLPETNDRKLTTGNNNVHKPANS